MVSVKQVQSKSDLKRFVKFPFSLYKDSPYWVPPIIKDEMASFDKDENPVFKTAEAQSTIEKILIEDDFIDASQLVKEALRSLAKG